MKASVGRQCHLAAAALMLSLWTVTQPTGAAKPVDIWAGASGDHVREEHVSLAGLEAALPDDARLRLFAISDRPGLFVMHAPSLAEQGAMFSRIVALFERADLPRDRIVAMSALRVYARRFGADPAGLTAGNDFSAGQLARFFDMARQQREPLTPGERRLLSILSEWGLIVQTNGRWRARSAQDFLITVPGLGPAPEGEIIDASVRAAILSHELGHWRYFSDQGYANACHAFWWRDLTYAERAELTRELVRMGYDPRDGIVIDEMQAYLLHTPAPFMPLGSPAKDAGIDIVKIREGLRKRVDTAG